MPLVNGRRVRYAPDPRGWPTSPMTAEERRKWAHARSAMQWEWVIEKCIIAPDGEESWRPVPKTRMEPPADLYLAQHWLLEYRNAMPHETLRLACRLVGEWMAVVQWTNPRRTCRVCGAEVTVKEDLRFVEHGVLIARGVDASGKKFRISRPCEGSGMRA